MSARRPIFNHLVAPLVGGPVLHAEAKQMLDAYRDETLREWAGKVREVGGAKGWSTWAAAYMDPDVEFVDTGMPATETIVAELRRLDRVAVLREAADAINSLPHDYECDPGRGDAADLLRRMADAAEGEKGTSDGSQPPEGESTPVPTDLLHKAAVFEIPRACNPLPLQLRRSIAGGDRWMICDREGRRWHRDHGFVYEAQNEDERTRTGTRFPLAVAWPLAHRIAADETSAHATGPDGVSQ